MTPFDIQLKQIRDNALQANVPILSIDAQNFLKELIHSNPIHTVLEIGTAVGYSSLWMASLCPLQVYTIERNVDMIEQARKNIQICPKQSMITLIEQDALTVSKTSLPRFDLIFIDGAKAQYQAFFEAFEENLNEGGFILCDNLDFHGYVSGQKEATTRDLKQLVRKIGRFIDWLKQNPHYETTFYAIGDGLSISRKRGTR